MTDQITRPPARTRRRSPIGDLPNITEQERLRAYVTASRASQGLPPTVQDPATLERVAAILRLVAPQLDQPRPTTRNA